MSFEQDIDLSKYGTLGPENLPTGRGEQFTALNLELDLQNETLKHRESVEPYVSISKNDFDGVVFDVDGTLINSEPAILFSIFSVAEEFVRKDLARDFEFSKDQIEQIKERCFGVGDAEMSVKLLQYLRQNDLGGSYLNTVNDQDFIDDFSSARKETYLELCRCGAVQAMPGAINFVQSANRAFGPLSINTGSPAEHSEVALDSALSSEISLKDVFPVQQRTFGDELGPEHGKPDPAGYTLAAHKAELALSRLIAVVDRPNDAIAALDAGYGLVIVVPEDMDPLPFADGKHSLIDYMNSFPDSYKLKRSDRVIFSSSLENIRFE